MPTLIFKFKTDGVLDKRKYSQLKLRLNYKTNEITDELINKLKLEIFQTYFIDMGDLKVFMLVKIGSLKQLYLVQIKMK